MSEPQIFEDIYARLLRHKTQAQASEFRVEWYLLAGMETRLAKSDYSWHGLKRNADPNHPYFVFQFTLSGRGGFEQDGKTYSIEPGQAFMAVVPSEHRYFLPPDSPSWTFFWLTNYHPYVVSRLSQTVLAAGPVLTIGPETRLMTRSIALWEERNSGAARDALAAEEALFEWMFELERYCNALLYPQAQRDHWLGDVRNFVLSNLTRSCDVAELAQAQGLSRSHFSHRFKAATGLSPAVWVQHIRLEEASRRLARTDDKLERIAHEVGLGDANHLCKVFRRHFHLSPGEFRRQMK